MFDIGSQTRFDRDRWRFTGRVEPVVDEFEGWTASVMLTGIGEDGSRHDEIPISAIDSSNGVVTTTVEEGVAKIVAGPSADAVTFEGISEPIEGSDFLAGRVGETQLEIRAELDLDGGD